MYSTTLRTGYGLGVFHHRHQQPRLRQLWFSSYGVYDGVEHTREATRRGSSSYESSINSTVLGQRPLIQPTDFGHVALLIRGNYRISGVLYPCHSPIVPYPGQRFGFGSFSNRLIYIYISSKPRIASGRLSRTDIATLARDGPDYRISLSPVPPPNFQMDGTALNNKNLLLSESNPK